MWEREGGREDAVFTMQSKDIKVRYNYAKLNKGTYIIRHFDFNQIIQH